MKIQVTEEDIKKGEPGSCEFCAISQALRKKFNALEVLTQYDHEYDRIRLTVDGQDYQVSDYDEDDVNNFIEAYDNYSDFISLNVEVLPPKPISFTIYEV